MRICAKLEIPFVTLNLEKEYKQEVVDYMVREYKEGRTPNPDVMCNKYVKFGAFFSWARKQGADFIATGHYAQIELSNKRYELITSEDTEKDQTYFLWLLTQKQLSHTLFPIGHLKKSAVRKLAQEYNLPTALKKDSQGLCFVGKVDMKDFLKHFLKEKKGKVLDENGSVLGHHPGSIFFTLGERHGFTINKKSSQDLPYYVVAKNLRLNTLTVSHNPSASFHDTNNAVVQITDCNWITESPQLDRPYLARMRYRQPVVRCQFISVGKTSRIRILDESAEPTPGQSLVLYSNNQCIGGGVIEKQMYVK
jgi:tRNA-specific 2-thiouridylase